MAPVRLCTASALLQLLEERTSSSSENERRLLLFLLALLLNMSMCLLSQASSAELEIKPVFDSLLTGEAGAPVWSEERVVWDPNPPLLMMGTLVPDRTLSKPEKGLFFRRMRNTAGTALCNGAFWSKVKLNTLNKY